jgi:peroxiredoxin
MSNNKVVLVPSVVFKTRVRDETIEEPNPYAWFDLNTFDLFADKQIEFYSYNCDKLYKKHLEEENKYKLT